jgi:hypothetical protein
MVTGLAALALAIQSAPASGQHPPPLLRPHAMTPAADNQESSGPGVPTWLRPVASAVAPGSGQLLAGQDRGAAYIAVEALLAIRFLLFHAEGGREGRRYRDLAFTVARGPFNPTVRDTAFEYFEQLEKFIESGPFDTDPGTAFAPPIDEASYNGSIWALARRTFFPNPDSLPDPDSEEFQRALAFYRTRAVGPNFQWSWRNAGLEQDLFRSTIRQSDEAFRDATQQLGLILANHLLSAVDAFVSGRLSGGQRRVAIGSLLWRDPQGPGIGWAALLRVGF